MAKKQGKAGSERLSLANLSPEQLKVFQAQLDLQDRAVQMAQAAADRQLAEQLRKEQEARDIETLRAQQAAEDADRAAKRQALLDVASIYSRQGADVAAQYETAAGDIERQRQTILQQLADAVSRGETSIGSAQEQFLKDLVESQAYQNVPLIELGQIQNPLLAGLQAEGASTAGVQTQTEQDKQVAAQLAALTRGAMTQLNVGEQNYLAALRNAGALSAQESRNLLAGTAASRRMDIQSQYDQLANQIAQRRLEDIADIQSREAASKSEAAGYAPIERTPLQPTEVKPFDYNAAYEQARLDALAAIRSALPQPVTTPKPSSSTATTGSSPMTGSAPIYVPYQNLPKDATLTPAQLKRKREQEDLIALRQRGL